MTINLNETEIIIEIITSTVRGTAKMHLLLQPFTGNLFCELVHLTPALSVQPGLLSSLIQFPFSQ